MIFAALIAEQAAFAIVVFILGALALWAAGLFIATAIDRRHDK